MPNTTLDLNAPLEDAYRRIAPCFGRSEPRARSRRYLAGLLSTTERKNGWQLAEQGGERHPRGIQRLLDEAEWDADEVRDEVRRYVVDHLGQQNGILIVDETGFVKKGTKSAGVANQYSGTAGGRENQQIGVFLAYASAAGCAFIDRELYVPQEWLDDPSRCREAGIPASRAFATKPQLAQQMLEHAFAAAVPAQWVVGDCIYGSEDLRHWLEAQGQPYLFAVASTHALWEQGEQIGAADLVAQHPELGWVRWSAGEGSQGPRRYDWAWMRLPYTSAAGMTHWLLIRRSLSLPEEYAYYRAYGAETTSLPDLIAVAGQRWQIEVGFEGAKGEVGLDEYEVRLWQAWYRHITLALLAYAVLVVARSATVKRGHNGVRGLQRPRDPTAAAAAWPGRGSCSPRVASALVTLATAAPVAGAASPHPPTHSPAGHGLLAPDASHELPTPLVIAGLPPLTATHWERIAPLLPAERTAGRPYRAHRQILEAMLWVMTAGTSWRQLPPAFGPWETVYYRFQRWKREGFWEQIRTILLS